MREPEPNALADRILDRPYADPDDDAAQMARAFVRQRALLTRARNGLLLESRREAFNRLPEPTPLLLALDAALGIDDHQAYVDVDWDKVDERSLGGEKGNRPPPPPPSDRA